jgi:hypothetical protein
LWLVFSTYPIFIDPSLHTAVEPTLPSSTASAHPTDATQQTPLPQPQLASTGGIDVDDGDEDLNEDDDDANNRYNINKAAGFDPFDRADVQSRRREISEFLLSEYNVRLNKPYTRWNKDRWNAAVSVTWEKFVGAWSWKREGARQLLQLMCRDNVKNHRKRIAQQQKAAAEAGQPSSSTGRPGIHIDTHSQGNPSVLRTPKKQTTPQKKTLLRRPNRNARPGPTIQSPAPPESVPAASPLASIQPSPTSAAIPTSAPTTARVRSPSVLQSTTPGPVASAATRSSLSPVCADYSVLCLYLFDYTLGTYSVFSGSYTALGPAAETGEEEEKYCSNADSGGCRYCISNQGWRSH